MHDTTCGPALTDIAAMRDALAEAGGDPVLLNPTVPVGTSTDHSIAVDSAGSRKSLARNMAREMERNAEGYRFKDADGIWRPAIRLPDEVRGPLANAVLTFLMEEGLAKRRLEPLPCTSTGRISVISFDTR